MKQLNPHVAGKRRSRRLAASRRGSTYLIVLFTSMIVAVVAFAGFQRMRVEERTASMQRDWDQASVLAASAVEFALAKLGNDHAWRDVYSSQTGDNYSAPVSLGQGMLRWKLEDPADGDIANDPDDPVRIFGRGIVGDSERVFSMLAWPSGSSMDVLRSAVHAGGNLQNSASLDVRDGPVSANKQLSTISGTLLGDVEATSVDAPDQVIGTVTRLPTPKSMSASLVFSLYQSLSTQIPSVDLGSGTSLLMQSMLVSPAQKPTAGSGVNADGVYLVSLGNYQTLTIRDCRIEGTLLIQLGDYAQLIVGPNVLWRPARADYPALLVQRTSSNSGEVTIECSGKLVEASLGVNFNPLGTPYFGQFDTDLSDVYAASLSGLFHVIDASSPGSTAVTTIRAPRKIRGCILVDGDVRIDRDSILVADPYLYAKPPLGYSVFPDPTNLLINGDAENAATGWSKLGANTEVTIDADAHAGSAALLVDARDTAMSGIQQDVTARLLNGALSGLPLTCETWIKMRDSDELIEIVLELDSSGEGVQRFVMSAPATTQWSRVQVEHIPQWTGTLNYARWQVTSTVSEQAFLIDDAIIHAPGNGRASTLAAVPGSWRAETLPAQP